MPSINSFIANAFLVATSLLLASCANPQTNPRQGKHPYSEWEKESVREWHRLAVAEPDKAVHFFRLGYFASHLKEPDTVHRNYRRAIELDPSNQWYQISYGWALFNAEAYDDALAQWRKAYDFCDGTHDENNITVALGYYGVRDYENAAKFFLAQTKVDSRYSRFDTLQEATSHWTWHEKEAVYRLYDIWRYSYGRR